MIHETKEVADFLGCVSKSFCLAKWAQISLHLQIGHGHSCHHPPTHKITLEEIAQDPANLHNTVHKKEQQEAMRKGERPSECGYCWKLEDSGEISDRYWKSARDWAFDYREKIVRGELKNPTYVEVSFDNTCNFKCAYCSPSISSSWMEEIKQLGGYPTSDYFNDLQMVIAQDKMPILQKDYNPYVEAFWKWWPDLVKDLQVFRITGGEPLLSKNTWKVFDFLKENKYPDLKFAINSNMCVSDQLISRFIENINEIKHNVREIVLFASIDTHGKQAEYIRFGLDYQRFMSNINRYLEETDLSLVYMISVNNLSLVNSLKLFEEILKQKKKYGTYRIVTDTPYLRYPQFLAVDLLPEKYKQYWETVVNLTEANQNNIGGFSEFEISRLKRVLPIISSQYSAPTSKRHMQDFVKYIDEYDKRRNTNFFVTFPELLEFYYQCKSLCDV